MTKPPTPTAPSYGDPLTDWVRSAIEAQATGAPMPIHPDVDYDRRPNMDGAMTARQLSEPARAVVDELDKVAELGAAAAVLYGQGLGDVIDRTLASARYRVSELDDRLHQADRFAVDTQQNEARLERVAVDLCRERDRLQADLDGVQASVDRQLDELRTERAFLRLYTAELVRAVRYAAVTELDEASIQAELDQARDRAKVAVGHDPAGVVDPQTAARAFHDAYGRLPGERDEEPAVDPRPDPEVLRTIAERESSAPAPEPGERTGPLQQAQQAAPDLVDTLRLGNQYGSMGVALTATLTDQAILARRIQEPGR